MTMPALELLLVPASGPSRMVTVERHYADMAKLIGAEYVEHVRTPIPGVCVFVDEEGLLRDRPVSQLSWILYPGVLAGDALIGSEVDGTEGLDITTLSREHLLQLVDHLINPRLLVD